MTIHVDHIALFQSNSHSMCTDCQTTTLFHLMGILGLPGTTKWASFS